MIDVTKMRELADTIETAWMAYNAAVVNRLHAEEQKRQLANVLINNTTDIIKALRKESDAASGDIEAAKKVRKSGER